MAVTYLAVKPDSAGIAVIQSIQRAIKLNSPIQKEKLHCTLMYSKEVEVLNYQPCSHIVYRAEVTGCSIIGEKGSPRRAIVLMLHSPSLSRRFNYAASTGLKHSFPEFSPHISLAYGDDVECYLQELEEFLASSPQITLNLTSEYSKVI